MSSLARTVAIAVGVSSIACAGPKGKGDEVPVAGDPGVTSDAGHAHNTTSRVKVFCTPPRGVASPLWKRILANW